MKNENRIIQHKPQRESKEKEKSQLKKENRELKKEILKIRKQLSKINNNYNDKEEFLDSMASKEKQIDNITEVCSNCGSKDLIVFPLPNGSDLIGCKNCKKRKQ